MVDGWMGDDWFHYGAFRQANLDYFTEPDDRSAARAMPCRAAATTTTTNFLRAGSAGDFAQGRAASTSCRSGARSIEHPAYDAFWQEPGARQD